MFTGIVEETGRVLSFRQASQAWRLQVAADVVLQDVSLGDSIAVNGCCLTVANIEGRSLTFDVLEETRRLTNFAAITEQLHVNLERSLRFDGKVGGHFVTGHIDEQGTIECLEQRGNDYYLQVKLSSRDTRLIVHKGSIAIDGVSLTVAEVEPELFAVWLIPTTLAITNFGEKKVGDPVNLEFDLLGKYVEKFTRHQSKATPCVTA
jgi:riboflavin synthase|uniref:riboflavin synthase n=1 Tax=Cephaloticoccus sp. TaxID=1985742 RepID=UPI004049C523